MHSEQTVFVTGGTGFIGRRLVHRLAASGARVRVLSRQPSLHRQDVELVRGDLLEGVDAAALAGVTCIYHCAGEVRHEPLMAALHEGGTRRLLEQATHLVRTSGKPVRWIQLSSVGAYGEPSVRSDGEPALVAADAAEAPRGTYELTKTKADALLRQACAAEPRLEGILLRPTTVFGPGMPNDSVRALLRAIARGRFLYIGAGDAVANYVHVDDVVSALLHCTSVGHRGGVRTFIVANDCPLRAIVEAVCGAAGRRPPVLRVPEGMARALVALAPRGSIPLTPSRIDALTRRVHYRPDALAASGFVPCVDVPSAMAELYRLECAG